MDSSEFHMYVIQSTTSISNWQKGIPPDSTSAIINPVPSGATTTVKLPTITLKKN